MAVSTAQANAMLGGLPGTLYVQAHSGDPGAGGTANTISGSTRGTVSLPAAVGGTRGASGASDCPGVPLGATVTHVSYWDALNAGTFQFSAELGSSVPFTYAGTLRLVTQTFTISTSAGSSSTATSINTDSTAGGDSNVARHIVNVTDTASASDSNGVAVGVFSGNTDTTTSSDTQVLVLGLAISDTSTASDSNTAQVPSGGITYVAAGTTFYNGSVNDGTAFEVALPAGVQENDILLLLVGAGVYSTVNGPASGWTETSVHGFSGTGFTSGRVYWRRAGASETNPSCTAYADDGGGPMPSDNVARIYAFRGCAASGSPIDAGATQNTGTGTTVTGSALTTATANAMIVMIGGAITGNITYSTPGVTVDTIVEAHAAGYSILCAYDDAPSNSAGAKSAPTASANSSPSDGFAVFTLALKPA